MATASAHPVVALDAQPPNDAVVEALAKLSELTARMSAVLDRNDVAKLQGALESVATNLARHSASELERSRLYEAEHRARAEAEAAVARLSLLAKASRLFAETQQDLNVLLKAVCDELVEAMGDSCSVLLTTDTDVLDPVAVKHRDEVVTKAMMDTLSQAPIRAAESLVGRVALDLKPVLLKQVDVTKLPSHGDATYRAFHERYPVTSVIAVPMRASSRLLGVLALARYGDSAAYTDADLALAQELADRAALAVSSAQALNAERALVRAREEFLSIASHELRTPLTPIALRLQSLAADLNRPTPPERLREHVEVMNRQFRKLTNLVNGLLDVTRIGVGKLTVARETVNLAELIREVVLRHEAEAANAGCTLYMDVPEQVTGEFDPMRVEQVATNLMSNALKYGAGHPIRVSLSETARNVQLVVDDEGVGIDAEDLPRLFGRFERAESGMSYSGLGLGLFITRQIVEAHGGLIRVESAPGKGSRFEVELPKTGYTDTPKSRSA